MPKSYFNLESWCILDYFDYKIAKSKANTSTKSLYNHIDRSIEMIRKDQMCSAKDEKLRILNLRKIKLKLYEENNEGKKAIAEAKKASNELGSLVQYPKSIWEQTNIFREVVYYSNWIRKIQKDEMKKLLTAKGCKSLL